MKAYDFVFGATLDEMILRHSDNLSQYLQKKTISAAEGQHVAKMVMDILQSVRTEESYDLFWQKLLHFSECNNVQGSTNATSPEITSTVLGWVICGSYSCFTQRILSTAVL